MTAIPQGSTDNRKLWAKWKIIDVDGNIYTEVKIGNQVWMVENLRTTKFNDKTVITYNKSSIWDNVTYPAYCWYKNNEVNKEAYGALYSWYTVETGELAPMGWHVPTDADWTKLSNHLGNNAGGKLKEKGKTHWNAPNQDATNESGFTALPGGAIHVCGFTDKGKSGYYWSATKSSTSNARHCHLSFNNGTLSRADYNKGSGFSVRLVRDY